MSTELVFAQTETLQFSLHEPASLQNLLPITQVALLGQGHVEANGAAMADHLIRRGRFPMGGPPGPAFTDPNAVAGMDWGGTATPGAGLDTAARRPPKNRSQ